MFIKLLLTFIFIISVMVIWPNVNPIQATCAATATSSWGDCSCSTAGCDGLQYASGQDDETFDSCTLQQSCNTTPNSDSCNCGAPNHNLVSCGPDSQCTGVLGDGCGYCQTPVCNNNGVRDNGETGVDCGGGGCGSCAPSSGGGGGGGTTTPPAVTCAAPALTNPTYNCASTSVTLYWSSASGASSYKPRMQRYVNNVTTYTPLDSRNNCSPHNVCIDNLNATSLSNVAVNPGSRYDWWVHSTCGSYPSANSSFTVPSCPSAPTNLTATCAAGGASATLSWSASSGASSYTVRVPTNLNGSGWSPAWGTNATAGDAIYTTSSTSLIFQISPNTNYGWSVQPVAAGETSSYGAAQTAAPTGFNCPSCPAGSCQTTTAGCSNYNAFPARACPSGTCQTTTASSYDGISCTGTSACSNYNAFPAASIPACRTSDGSGYNGSSCTQTAYSANCSTACNGAGSSCCASLPAAPALAGFSPATGSTLRTAGNTTFSWNEIAGVAGYYFRLSPNGISCSAADDYCPGQITSNSISHTLTVGTDYTWWVHGAIASSGSCETIGPYTSATLHVCSAMTTPGSLSPSGTINAGTQDITWSAVAGATGYYLRVEDQTDGSPLVDCNNHSATDVCTGVLSDTTTSYSYTFLAGHTYNIWVREVVDSNPACYSNQATSSVTVRPIPPQPTITVTPACINTGNDGSGISIRWTNNSPVTWVDISTSSDFSAYYHKQITGSVAGASGSTNGTGFNLSTGGGAVLTYSPNTTYYVRLFDGQNNSDPTNPANFSISPCCNNDCSSSCSTTTQCGNGLSGTCSTTSYSGGGACTATTVNCLMNKPCTTSGQTCDDATHTCTYSPWIQVEGDVHSNSGINTPGGP